MHAQIEILDPNEADALPMRQLADSIADANLAATIETQQLPGRKSSELITAIQISLSSVSLLLSILAAWRARQPTYSITVSHGDIKVAIANLTPNGLLETAQKLQAANPTMSIKVNLRRG